MINRTVFDKTIQMGQLAAAFASVNRITCLPNGRPESDTDHTVALGLIACSLASVQGGLDVGLVAQYALAHDIVEVYAGDAQTLRISPDARMEKHRREAAALEHLAEDFGQTLPWLTDTIRAYEVRETPESRFVWTLDKCLPKILHVLDRGRTMRDLDMGVEEFTDRMVAQREELERVAADFPLLLDLHFYLVGRTVAALAA